MAAPTYPDTMRSSATEAIGRVDWFYIISLPTPLPRTPGVAAARFRVCSSAQSVLPEGSETSHSPGENVDQLASARRGGSGIVFGTTGMGFRKAARQAQRPCIAAGGLTGIGRIS